MSRFGQDDRFAVAVLLLNAKKWSRLSRVRLAWWARPAPMETPRRKAVHDAMVRLADGDRGAFDLLLDQLWPVVLSLARVRGVAQWADAEDIAKDVFIKICALIAEFDRARDGLSCAFGIASYEILTHRRRLQRRR